VMVALILAVVTYFRAFFLPRPVEPPTAECHPEQSIQVS